MEYIRLVHRRALQETNRLWTSQRLWVAFASPIVTVPVRGLFFGWTAGHLGLTAVVTLVVVAALWVLTFLFDLLRAPGLLHRERITEAAAELQRVAAELQRVKEESRLALSLISEVER